MNPFGVFESLGPLDVYRRPDLIADEWARVEAAQAELRARFDASVTDRERLDVVVGVTAQLVAIARRRASACQLKCPGLACENLDIETVLAQWVEFVQSRLESGARR